MYICFNKLKQTTMKTKIQEIIEIQQRQLNQYKGILKPEVFADLKNWAESTNKTAARWEDVRRGSDFEQFMFNHEAYSGTLEGKATKRLEYFIIDRVQRLKIDFLESDNVDTFDKLKDYYSKSNRLPVWKGASENTIFSRPEINWYFRAWHDLIHLENNYDFSPLGEINTCIEQINELPNEWSYERNLLIAEVIGQVMHFEAFKAFPDNQVEFTKQFLNGKLVNS